MKHLLIVLMCTIIGFSASAGDLTSKKNLPFINKAEVKVTNTKNSNKAGHFRIQRRFLFEDNCGGMWIVYVSGPNSATSSQMEGVGRHDFLSGCDESGCFQGLVK